MCVCTCVLCACVCEWQVHFFVRLLSLAAFIQIGPQGSSLLLSYDIAIFNMTSLSIFYGLTWWWKTSLLPYSMVKAHSHLTMWLNRMLRKIKWNVLKVKVTQSCPTLWDPMDCSLPGSAVHEILQARILEWVAIPLSRRSSPPRDWTQVSCTAGRFFTFWATRKSLKYTEVGEKGSIYPRGRQQHEQ